MTALRNYWPVLPLTLLWLALRMLQVGPPLLVADTLIVLLPGFLSSLVVVFLYLKARPGVQRWFTIGGYVLSLPIAFLGALGSGMVLPALGITAVGTILSALGSLIGFAIGAAVARLAR